MICIEAVYFDGTVEVIFEMYPTNSAVKRLCTITISGADVGFGHFLPPGSPGVNLIYKTCSEVDADVACTDSALEAIQNHTSDLFGNEKEYRVDMFSLYDGDSIPRLHNIRSSRVWAYPTINGKIVDSFCSESPNQDFLQVLSPINGRLDENSKLYGMKAIDVHEGFNSELLSDIFRRFTGIQAFLSSSKLEISRLIEFVNRWKSNEGSESLEVLVVSFNQRFDLSNRIEIENSIGIRELSSENNAPEFHYKRRYNLDPNDFFSHSFVSNSYVVRDHDQRVASVLLNEEKFSIGIWDLTENEFLEKCLKS
ncbi:hypothetical protein GCK72_000582 [Caenorhabditis remanei]|uniref:F-box associated domain-containing protein n=1 Tax=Caenorhabditis remanei TaxID=31234 RepID=A0A6A5HME6_CAERE|nr:hypothetical protein GCK72_000582 [Caenorhabditis remanei]KAF1768769.1 hypothetical protein GCK72_000582 [Caenorhabditis remanei]